MASYQVPVPEARTRAPSHTDTGLFSAKALPVRVGARQLFALDWRNDQAVGGRIVNFQAVSKISGIGEANFTIAGEDRQLTKFWIEGITEGGLVASIDAIDREGHEGQAHFLVNVTT